jgi:hypothetical protein
VTVKLAKNDTTERSGPYAFIRYTSQDDAFLALENMDHRVWAQHIALVFLGTFKLESFKPEKDRFRG